MTQIATLIERLGSPRVLIVGDLILDCYVDGEALRVSPEAPVLVFESSHRSYRLGGASNVAANVVSMGGKASCLGIVGKDPEAEQLRAMLVDLGIGVDLLLTEASRPTTRKTRYVSKTHQVLRVDEETRAPVDGPILDPARAALRERLGGFQAVILSDYGKGMLTREFIALVVSAAKAAGIPVLVDPKGVDYSRYRGATLVTPNKDEAEAATGIKVQRESDLDAIALRLMEVADLDAAVITLGKEGIFFRSRTGERRLLPTEARSVFDVTGAGDTVVAILGLCLADKMPLVDALRLANQAAGIVVGRFGTASVTRDELLGLYGGAGQTKILARDQLPRLTARLRGEGRKIVFTNGCFDLLHPGHVDYLRLARSYGDGLVVGVNSDESIQRSKGKSRPICPLKDRLEMLAALDSVDYLAAFDEDTPRTLIEEVSPHVLVKGEDWREKGVVGREWVEAHGGRVVLVPLREGYSTSELIRRIVGRETRA